MRGFETIGYEEKDGLAVVRLDRPESLNAISSKMAEEFVELAEALAGARRTRVVVLTGAGRAFSTGRDLKESATHSKETADRYQRGRDGDDDALGAPAHAHHRRRQRPCVRLGGGDHPGPATSGSPRRRRPCACRSAAWASFPERAAW